MFPFPSWYEDFWSGVKMVSARPANTPRAAFKEIVGEYRIGHTLGTGNYGIVKEATKKTTGEKFAVKIINGGRTDYVKLRREIENQQRLHHKHVVEVQEVIRDGGDAYIIMEKISGVDLFDYINEFIENGEYCPEKQVRRIFQQLMAGVMHCHVNKVAHRDLKPENIFLDAERNVKIIDFGLSASMKDGAFLTESCGSPNYAAPELLEKTCQYDGRGIDIWSCGVVLYVLLCNRLPFDATPKWKLYRSIQLGKFIVPDHVSCEAKDLIVKMLTVDRNQRINMAGIRKHPWFSQDLPDGLFQSCVEIPQDKQFKTASIGKTMKSLLELTFEPISSASRFEEKIQTAITSSLMPVCVQRDKSA